MINSPIFLRFFLPISLFVGGLLLGLLGGNYLYREREIIAAEFFLLGCGLSLCGLWLGDYAHLDIRC